jgi:hypothetical protein
MSKCSARLQNWADHINCAVEASLCIRALAYAAAGQGSHWSIELAEVLLNQKDGMSRMLSAHLYGYISEHRTGSAQSR